MTTLSTKGTSSDSIKDLNEFIRCILSFDHYYAFSDDHGAYLAGRRVEERILDYAGKHKQAQAIWDYVCDARSEQFFAGQLITHVEKVIFADDRDAMTAAVNSLEDFCIGYLASTGSKSMLGKSIRRGIARSNNWWFFSEKTEVKVEAYIASYERKGR